MVNSRCGHCESSINTDEPRREREGCCFTMNVWEDRINRYLQNNVIRLKAETTSDCDLIRQRRQTIFSTMEKMAIELPIRGRRECECVGVQTVVTMVVIFESGKGELNCVCFCVNTFHVNACTKALKTLYVVPPAALICGVDSKDVQLFFSFLCVQAEEGLPVLVQVVDQIPVEAVLCDDVYRAWEQHSR